MFRNILRLNALKPRNYCKKSRRTFLSESYKCTDAWENRLKATAFKKIDLDDLYYQLDRSFQIGWRISVLDIDLFMNCVKDETMINEVEDILLKLRLNPETGDTYDSTQHAVIRYYISLGKYEDLLRVLSDKMNYGIFPDNHLSNLLMDTFLKKGDTVSAAKIAVLQMLQEDFKHPITRCLSLYSCHKYLNSEQLWEQQKEEESVDDDDEEEEVRVRVRYLRNPYFDDHFDLVKPNHLIGKTLTLAGREIEDSVGVSSQIIGLTLHEKFAENIRLLESLIQKKPAPVHGDALAKVKEYVEKTPKSGETEKASDSDEIKKCKERLTILVDEVKKVGNIVKSGLEEDLEMYVEDTVKKFEQQDIEEQCRTYKRWEDEREQKIQDEIFEENKRRTLEEIEKTKKELCSKEEELFFFENEEKYDLLIEDKMKERENYKVYKGKGRARIKTEEEYIPPDVVKKLG